MKDAKVYFACKTEIEQKALATGSIVLGFYKVL